MEKIKSFDFHKKLFDVKANTIPIHKFLPENLTMLLLSVMAASACGGFFDFSGMGWYFSLPCAIGSGLCICFIVQYLLENAVDSFKRNNLPKGEFAAGLDGYCVEKIETGDWGKVCLFHKEREFRVNAVTDGEIDIDEGEKVISVYENDGFYYVVRIDKLNTGIDDEP